MARMYPVSFPGSGLRPRTWTMILTVTMLTACAHFDGKQAPSVAARAPAAKPVTTSTAKPAAGQKDPLTQELLYDILLGEIAGQRGRLDVAASR